MRRISKKYLNRNRQTRLFLFRKSDVCGICGEKFNSLKDATLDHIIPLSKGGPLSFDNLQLAHAECNRLKDNKIIIIGD